MTRFDGDAGIQPALKPMMQNLKDGFGSGVASRTSLVQPRPARQKEISAVRCVQSEILEA